MNKKVLSRLGIFFIGVPIVLVIIWLPFFNHISFHLFLCFVVLAVANEMYDILSVQANDNLLPKPFLLILSVSIPFIAGMYAVLNSIEYSLPFSHEVITYSFIITIVLCFFAEVFGAKDFGPSNAKLASSFFLITYCGFLPTYLQRLTVLSLNNKPITVPLLCVFVMMVFLCDSFAWLLGVLFGKNNRGFVKASPNKSIVGFVGGFIGSVVAGIVGYKLWPEIFATTSYSFTKMIFTGILIAFSSIVGDLAESVIKRSAGVKDSGKIIPGRGGMLDSCDSIFMAAPVYYLLITIFFGPFN